MAKSNCDDCFYRCKLNGGSIGYCKYLFVTGQRRPCNPGEECTVKVSVKLKRRKKKNG